MERVEYILLCSHYSLDYLLCSHFVNILFYYVEN